MNTLEKWMLFTAHCVLTYSLVRFVIALCELAGLNIEKKYNYCVCEKMKKEQKRAYLLITVPTVVVWIGLSIMSIWILIND